MNRPPITHKEVFSFIINDWLDAEFADEGACELQEKVRKLGVRTLYEMYMGSDSILVPLDGVTDVVNNLFAAQEAAEGGKYE